MRFRKPVRTVELALPSPPQSPPPQPPTGLRIGAEVTVEVSGPRATPAALQTLQQETGGCDPVKSLQRAFLARV